MHEHYQEFIGLYPRTEPLETPINVEVIKHPKEITEYGWTRRAWTEKIITPVDNA
jgi:hypothetical protein